MKYLWILGVLPSFLSSLDCETAVQKALLNSALLKKPTLEIAIQEAESLQGTLWPNPSFSVELDGCGPMHATAGNLNTTTYSLSQPIPISGRISAAKKVGAWNTCIAAWDLEIQKQDLILSVKQAFIEGVAAEEKWKLSKARLENAPHEKEKAKNQLTLLTAKLAVKKAERSLEDSKIALARFWNEATIEESLFYPLSDIKPLPPLIDLEASLEETPDLKRVQAAFWGAQANYLLAEANKISDIEISGGISHWNHYRESSAFFEICVPLPIFDRNQGNIDRADLQTWQLVYQKEMVLEDLRHRLRSAYREWKQAYEEAAFWSDQMIPCALKALEEARESSDKTDAQSALLDAKESALEAKVDYHKKKGEIERLINAPLF